MDVFWHHNCCFCTFMIINHIIYIRVTQLFSRLFWSAQAVARKAEEGEEFMDYDPEDIQNFELWGWAAKTQHVLKKTWKNADFWVDLTIFDSQAWWINGSNAIFVPAIGLGEASENDWRSACLVRCVLAINGTERDCSGRPKADFGVVNHKFVVVGCCGFLYFLRMVFWVCRVREYEPLVQRCLTSSLTCTVDANFLVSYT